MGCFMHLVAVTGMGIVSSIGTGVGPFTDALFAGRSGIGDISDITRADQRIRIGAPIRDFDPAAHFDQRTLAQIDRFTQFGAVAAREAWADAGLAAHGVAPHRVGVSVGTSVPGIDILDFGFRRFLLEGVRPEPLTLPMAMGNAPTSRIAYEVGARGPSFGINSACASSSHAMLLGQRLIASGAVDVFIAGGADSCFCDGSLRAWDSLRILSPEPCRPFSLGRRGISMGEGAGMLVLESLDHARRRGARVRALLRGGSMTSDAGGILSLDSASMAASIRAALEDTNLQPGDIDYINAHGTGSVASDDAEATAIVDVFSGRTGRVRVSSTKAATGHAMGAAGALEAIATIAALERQTAPPTLHFLEADPNCAIDATPNAAVAHVMRYALSNSFGFGGLNAVLVFEAAA